MNEYEILLMLDVELPDERAEEILTRMRELIEKDGGTWDGHEPWGRRKLAYEIDHKAEGTYHLVLFTRGAGDARRDLARAQDHRRRDAAPRRDARQGRPDEGAGADGEPCPFRPMTPTRAAE